MRKVSVAVEMVKKESMHYIHYGFFICLSSFIISSQRQRPKEMKATERKVMKSTLSLRFLHRTESNDLTMCSRVLLPPRVGKGLRGSVEALMLFCAVCRRPGGVRSGV